MTISQSEPLISIQCRLVLNILWVTLHISQVSKVSQTRCKLLVSTCGVFSELSCSLLSKELRNLCNNDLELYPVSFLSLKTTFIISRRTNRPVITWS